MNSDIYVQAIIDSLPFWYYDLIGVLVGLGWSIGSLVTICVCYDLYVNRLEVEE